MLVGATARGNKGQETLGKVRGRDQRKGRMKDGKQWPLRPSLAADLVQVSGEALYLTKNQRA